MISNQTSPSYIQLLMLYNLILNHNVNKYMYEHNVSQFLPQCGQRLWQIMRGQCCALIEIILALECLVHKGTFVLSYGFPLKTLKLYSLHFNTC